MLYGSAADQWRHAVGAALERVGLGPVEARYQRVFEGEGVCLRDYGGRDDAPPVLCVPAPIKKPYLWDLMPQQSAVRRLLAAGFRVYLAEWRVPPEPEWGLAEYADRFLSECVEAIGAPVLLAGHSLGGTLAGVFAALHPARVQALALLEAPLAFPASDAFVPLARLMPGIARGLPPQVPGSALNNASVFSAPLTFEWARWLDGWMSLFDPDAYATHLRALRWMYDESPLPHALLQELFEQLYRDDAFMAGALKVGARKVGVDELRAPLLAVADPDAHIIPLAAAKVLLSARPGADQTLLRYKGDVGVAVQHLGVLIGRNAHRVLWPQVVEWLRARAAPAELGRAAARG